jgi:cytochrome c oxidase cbb3-type subunit 4
MELNSIRSIVTVAGFLLFAALVLWTWRPVRRVAHEQAARLPFEGEAQEGTQGATE